MRVARFLSGSRAYGYATSGSDYDYREIHLAPFWKVASGMYLVKPKRGEGDKVSFELGHFASLCLKGSPNNVELLFLPPEFAEIDDRLEPLISMRRDFLNLQYQHAISHYCLDEMKALRRDIAAVRDMLGGDVSNRVLRAPKRLAHCFRLLNTGIELRNGLGLNVRRPEAEYLLRVRENPQEVFGGDDVMSGVSRGLVEVERLLRRFESLGDLPEPRPGLRESVAETVCDIRLAFRS